MITPENTVTYHNTLCLSPQNFVLALFQFLLGVKIAPRETEDDGYAKLWGDKQRALWYVMEFSGVVDSSCLLSSCILSALVILFGSSTINVIGTNTTNCLQN